MTTPANQPDLIAWLWQQLENQRFRAESLKTLAFALPPETGAYLTDTAEILLGDVDAKRRILAALDLTPCPCSRAQRCVIHDSSAGPPEFAVARYVDPVTEAVLSALALPFASQGDYREEWRPA